MSNRTAPHIVERNRHNSQLSTGPRTPEGKAIARRNSVRHGLTANPATGVVESPKRFKTLLRKLDHTFAPRNVMEAQAVHQIGVAIWRLQRAAEIDATMSDMQANGVIPGRDEIQGWIDRIHEAWRFDKVRESPAEWKARKRLQRYPSPDERWWRWKRSGLLTIDQMRDEEIMRSGSGITALIVMLIDLAGELRDQSACINYPTAEKLAWLLGDRADRLPIDDLRIGYPDEQDWASRNDEIIGRMRQPDRDEATVKAFDALVESRKQMFRQQREVAEQPYTLNEVRRQRTAALLPSKDTLDRLLRYETHADRSLDRALRRFALLRGINVETVMARVTQVGADGSTLEVAGQRTTCALSDHL